MDDKSPDHQHAGTRFSSSNPGSEPTDQDVAPSGLVGLQLSIRIHAQRRIAKVPIQALADATGLTIARLDAIEREQASLPAAVLPAIASALGKPIEWFYAPIVRRIPDARVVDPANCVSDTVPTAVLAAYAEQWLRIQATCWPDQTEPTNTAVTGLEGKRALLVEDSPDVLLGVAAFLEGAGMEVIKATNGDDALRIAATDEMLDVIITDYAMPGLSGVDLLVQLASLQPTLPGIIISAYAEAIPVKALPEHTRLLRKPFRRKVLIGNVIEIMRQNVVKEVQS